MTPELEEKIRALDRPDPSLWKYYMVATLPTLLFPPVTLVSLFLGWVRYSTLRYTFTEEGVSMRWGRLFRREVILNYARIQDIHLRSNIVERWFGLTRILVQTASGNSGAEMTIEGLKEYEAVRDFLYSKMRGVSDASDSIGSTPSDGAPRVGEVELAEALREVAREIQMTREAIEAWRTSPQTPPPVAPVAPNPSQDQSGA
jgi:putative membrane protein